MFCTPKDSRKGQCYVFSVYKERNNVSLVYLDCKLQQDTYSCSIFKSKCKKTVERIYLETSNNKQGNADVFRC